MPLSTTTLERPLLQLFSAPPATTAECARAWADALSEYAAEISFPSTTLVAATETLAVSLLGFGAPGAAVAVLEAGFAAFAATLAVGMLPGFAATPPPRPVGFATFVLVNRDTYAQAASEAAALIDTWMRTGIAINVFTSAAFPWN